MTALYFDVLRPQDRVAVKPHASPVFHAIQYLLGRQGRDKLERFRAFGGAQSYPSRTKDTRRRRLLDGLGRAGRGHDRCSPSLVQDYLRLKRLVPGTEPAGRMVALVGRCRARRGQRLRSAAGRLETRRPERLVDHRLQPPEPRQRGRGSPVPQDRRHFPAMGWDVVTLKYGRRLQAAFERPGGEALRDWIDDCPNSLYSALVYRGGAAWRARLSARPRRTTRGIARAARRARRRRRCTP